MQFNITHLRKMGPVAALLAMVLVWAGCGDNAAVPSAHYTYDNPPPALNYGDGSSGIMGTAGTLVMVAEEKVGVDGGVVAGGRYTMTVPAGALNSTEIISIQEYRPSEMEIELSPHGIQFNRIVTLEMDYKNTSCDPDHPSYDGSTPAFFYFNDSTGKWERVKGEDDSKNRVFTAYLTHFSRYALGGLPPGDGTGDW